MGLPLFVEPVKSDLRCKTATKPAAVSPPRADSGRPSRSELRDRRSGIRRAGTRIFGPLQRTNHPSSSRLALARGDRPIATWESESSREADTSSGPLSDSLDQTVQEAIREMGRNVNPRRDRLAERMEAIYSNDFTDAAWAAAVATADSVRPSGEPDAARRRRLRMTSPPPASVRLSSDPNGPVTLPRMHSSGPFAPAEVAATQPSSGRSVAGRPPRRRTTRPVDGLGDRNRSPSPEVWDTLLSTMGEDNHAPDPTLSFHVPMSRSARRLRSLNQATPGVDVDQEGVPIEASCESGCDCSDNEMMDGVFDHPARSQAARLRQRRPEASENRRRRHVPRYNLDGAMSDDGRTTRQFSTPHGSLTIYESTRRLPPAVEPAASINANGRETTASSASVWWGPGHHDSSNHDQRELFRTSTQNNSANAEDDLTGMQRIVRSLARREDIPDGWWAEAGLSRTLRQGRH